MKIRFQNMFETYETRQVDRPVAPREFIKEGEFPLVKIDGEWILQKDWERTFTGEVMQINDISRDPVTVGAIVFFSLVAGLHVGNYVYKQWEAFQKRNRYSPNEAELRSRPSPSLNRRFNANHQRIGEAVPVSYGRIRLWPDQVAEPYGSFLNNQEYAHALLCLGESPHDLEDIKIGESILADFGGDITAAAVADPLAAARVYNPESLPVRDFTPVEFPGDNPDGGTAGLRYNDTVHDNWLGPYPTSPPGLTTRWCVMDFYAPNGIHWQSSQGLRPLWCPIYAEFREINDLGEPMDAQGNATSWTARPPIGRDVGTGGSSPLAADRLTQSVSQDGTGNAQSAFPAGGFLMGPVDTALTGTNGNTIDLTKSRGASIWFQMPVFDRRYEMRVRMGRYKDDAQRVPDLYGIRGISPLVKTYPRGKTYISARIRATEQTVDARDRINVVATRMLRDFDKGGATAAQPAATRSLARAIYDICTNSDYGLGLPDSEIDLELLAAHAAFWDRQRPPVEFNGVYDRETDAWEALTLACQAGRCLPILHNGILTFPRDQIRTTPVALFTNANIIEGSFEMNVVMPADLAYDGTEATYFDARSWTANTAVYKWPSGTPNRPETVELFGITDHERAQLETEYRERARRLRRIIVKFETEGDGNLLRYGDPISVSHDIGGWGSNGVIAGWDGTHLLLSDPLPAGATVIALQDPAGRQRGPYAVAVDTDRTRVQVRDWQYSAAKSDADTAVFESTSPGVNRPDLEVSLGGKRAATPYAAGENQTYGELCLVTGISRSGTVRSSITALVEDIRVHTG